MKRLVLLGSGALHRALVRLWCRQPLRMAEVAWIVPAESAVHESGPVALLAGECAAADVMLPLAPLAAAAGVRLVVGTAAPAQPEPQLLLLSDGRRAEFDLLSLDSSLDLAPTPPGLAGALRLEPSLTCLELLQRLHERASGQAPDLLVAGGTLAACEAALAAQAGLGASGARVAWACGAAGPLPELAEGPRRVLLGALRRSRVAVLPDELDRIEPSWAQLRRGARAACDLALVVDSAQPSLRWPSAMAWQAPGDAQWAPLWGDRLARAVGGGPLPALPLQRAPGMCLLTGEGRALIAAHGWQWEGRLAGWWRQRRLRHALAAECRPPAATRAA